jgi:hypothetical protein
MENTSQNSGGDLAARVADIEKCIGDFAQFFEALKEILRGPGVDCPPYCRHGVEDDFKDSVPIADRVNDIRKCIGDFGYAFASIRKELEAMTGVDCPPYCAHIQKSKY